MLQSVVPYGILDNMIGLYVVHCKEENRSRGMLIINRQKYSKQDTLSVNIINHSFKDLTNKSGDSNSGLL